MDGCWRFDEPAGTLAAGLVIARGLLWGLAEEEAFRAPTSSVPWGTVSSDGGMSIWVYYPPIFCYSESTARLGEGVIALHRNCVVEDVQNVGDGLCGPREILYAILRMAASVRGECTIHVVHSPSDVLLKESHIHEWIECINEDPVGVLLDLSKGGSSVKI